jgi:uroporphyrinogen decarboxylase
VTKLLPDALHGRAVPRPPIWLMRQAGRYLPEYRALRSRAGSFLELCYTPKLAAEITLQPVRRFGIDGAILFSDILVVCDALGCSVEFVEGKGPRLGPVRDRRALAVLGRQAQREYLGPVYEAARVVAQAIPDDVALIGFAGAPWTLAAYMVEGEGSREFLHARRLARSDPELFGALIELLTAATAEHLLAQIEAGAEVVQLFDSWAGVLPEPEFRRWCVRPTAAIVAQIKAARPDVPVIVFPRGAGALYRVVADEIPADGLSLDTTVPLAWAIEQFPGVCLQGNLDPVALLTGGEALRRETSRILETMTSAGPFVFNLGHGVLPETDPDAVTALVEQVKSARFSNTAD